MTRNIPTYTNELTPEVLAEQNRSPFTPEQYASFSEEMLTIIKAQEAHDQRHPIVAIYRLATEGSRTHAGGVIREATTSLTIKLEDGSQVRAARTGDYAEYPDGSRARIVSGAGEQSHWSGHSLALVGSRLSNGDEIADTPQAAVLIAERQGLPMADDFLRERE